jgi:WD40 repeat protein
LAEEERQEIVHLQIHGGVVALEAEDTFTAAFYFAEALYFDQGRSERNHRMRIATALRQCPELLSLPGLEKPILSEEVRGAALSPDGNLLAVDGVRGALQVVDLGRGTVRELVASPKPPPVRSMSFPPDGRFLVTTDDQRNIWLWDLTKADTVPMQKVMAGGSNARLLSDNGRWLCLFDLTSHQGKVCDATTGEITSPPLQFEPDLSVAAVSPDGHRLAMVGPDNVVTVWDVRAARAIGRPLHLPNRVERIVFSPDADRVLLTYPDQSVQVWQVQTGQPRTTWWRLDGDITHAQFSPDGRLVLLGDDTGTVQVWDAVTGQGKTPPLRHAGLLACASFRGSGQEIITVGQNGVVRRWRLPPEPEVCDAAATAGAPGRPQEHRLIKLQNGITISADATSACALDRPLPKERIVEHAAFSPDGGSVAIREDGHTVRVWDTATGAPRTPLLRHRGVVLCAAFSPDGRQLLTAGDDRIARVWDARTGEVLTPPLRHNRAIKAVFFQADGERACVLHEGDAMTTWDLTPDGRPIEELLPLLRGRAGHNP